MESQFKKGDRVRFVKDCDGDCSFADKGEYGTIVKTSPLYGIDLDRPTYIWASEDYIELANPTDSKTAFLMELKGLLEKYGAVINASWNDGWQADDAKCPRIDVDICLGNGEYIDFDDVLAYSLTTDNIMDYDKE